MTEEMETTERTNGWFQNSVGSANVRSVQRNGREYLRFPLVPLREMVLDYPENGTQEYLPAESIAETVEAWDGVPITFSHPENRDKTARHPTAYTGIVIGEFFDPEFVGGEKLRGTALVDVEKAESIGDTAEQVVEELRAGEQLNVSAGYATVDDEHTTGTFQGDHYDLIQGPLFPDHIAVFPDNMEVMARCSPADGCAAPRVNCVCADCTDEQSPATETTNMSSPEIERLRDQLAALTKDVQELHASMDDDGRSRTNQTSRSNNAPAPGRTAYEQRKSDTPDYGPAGAPGGSKTEKRRLNASDEDGDSPAAGRSAWKQRQNGEAGGDNRHSDRDVPASGRSAWEERSDD
ncbi:DUF2213 domain-containing protein [Halomicrobium sp. LC1Hm]|uniref:DUF2213 domain-containing protein n=1 Tax=Halomicrobium sp. LC1Hm TaxID=2610902 RepID=UPI0012984207|nr:DUF2213 domain-containing protein [Halomicrobium sp. LC1Hm]QGA83713.1 hypothetical protein LC1Hm_2680 [Halomicrobium sp. LC1Hm]